MIQYKEKIDFDVFTPFEWLQQLTHGQLQELSLITVYDVDVPIFLYYAPEEKHYLVGGFASILNGHTNKHIIVDIHEKFEIFHVFMRYLQKYRILSKTDIVKLARIYELTGDLGIQVQIEIDPIVDKWNEQIAESTEFKKRKIQGVSLEKIFEQPKVQKLLPDVPVQQKISLWLTHMDAIHTLFFSKITPFSDRDTVKVNYVRLYNALFMKCAVYFMERDEPLTLENYQLVFAPYFEQLDSAAAVDAHFEQLQTDQGILSLAKEIFQLYLDTKHVKPLDFFKL